MVLAAGLGKRMRPLTDTMPKPLIAVAGRPLLDWGLDRLAEVGVARAVVNVHYLPDQIVAHVRSRRRPEVVISDESAALLDSGGGIEKALPLLGAEPFFIVNADTFWIDRGASNLHRLALAWDASRMDILLDADRFRQRDGPYRLQRLPGRGGWPAGAFGRCCGRADLCRSGDRAAAHLRRRAQRGAFAQPAFRPGHRGGRLFGMPMEGRWITVGTPDAIPAAEAAVMAAMAEGR